MEDKNNIVETSNNDVKTARKTSLIKEFFDTFEMFIISACAVLILFSVATRICRVDGDSMLNTLHNNEVLLVSDVFYSPARGDIIVFHQTGDQPSDLNEPIVKRVIATEGEWLDIKYLDGKLQVTVYDKDYKNPVILNEFYACYDVGVGYYKYDKYPIQVPDGCCFVMGDNRGNSLDSRSPAIGFVDSRRILGKVLIRLLPFEKFGTIK
jgi:signal peptidase I